MSELDGPGNTLFYPECRAATGLGTDLHVRIEDINDAIVVARSNADIVEYATEWYRGTRTRPADPGVYWLVWDRNDGGAEASERFEVTFSTGLVEGIPRYTTPDLLRGELDVDDLTLPDGDAIALIVQAEELIDDELGSRSIDADTGRKVVPADETTAAALKLSQATAKLAALLYFDPSLATAQRWKMVQGPDFTYSGRIGSDWGPLIMALLRNSGLLRSKGTRTLRTGPDIDRLRAGHWSA